MSDPIADMLTRIRNANNALLAEVDIPHSKVKQSIAQILKDSGYVSDWSVEGEARKSLKVKLKYNGRKRVIAGLRRVSKPGLRQYVGSREIPRVLGGIGDAIISTSYGVMSGVEAKKRRVGGELVCYVW